MCAEQAHTQLQESHRTEVALVCCSESKYSSGAGIQKALNYSVFMNIGQSEVSESWSPVDIVKNISNSLWTQYRSRFLRGRCWDLLPFSLEVCRLWPWRVTSSFKELWNQSCSSSQSLSSPWPAIKFLSVAPSAEICQVCFHWQFCHTYSPKKVSPAKIGLPVVTQWDLSVRFRREDTLLSLLSSNGLWSSLSRNCSHKQRRHNFLSPQKGRVLDPHKTPNICQIQPISCLLYLLI